MTEDPDQEEFDDLQKRLRLYFHNMRLHLGESYDGLSETSKEKMLLIYKERMMERLSNNVELALDPVLDARALSELESLIISAIEEAFFIKLEARYPLPLN